MRWALPTLIRRKEIFTEGNEANEGVADGGCAGSPYVIQRFIPACSFCKKGPMHPTFQTAMDLTKVVINAAIEVHRDQGPGLVESIYE